MVNPVPDLSPLELGLRVLGSAVLGGAVGFERQLRHQSAGFRTHILVSLGSCLFTLAGAYGVASFFGRSDTDVSFDPTRVAAQVVSGIGFLGAGAIIRTGASVRGLTTAAALWVTAAIGLAAGLGYWSGAVAVTVTTVLALYALRWLEQGWFRRLSPNQHEYVIEALPNLTVASLTEAVERHKGRVETMHLERGAGDSRRLTLLVRLPLDAGTVELAEALGGLDGVSSVDWKSRPGCRILIQAHDLSPLSGLCRLWQGSFLVPLGLILQSADGGFQCQGICSPSLKIDPVFRAARSGGGLACRAPMVSTTVNPCKPTARLL